MKASVLLLMAAAVAAAATGFMREAVVAYLFGTSATADAFSLVLLYTEGLYAVFNVGIAGYMLVPLVVRLDTEMGRRAAERLIETLQLWTAFLFLILGLFVWLSPEPVARAMAPGFNAIQHTLLAQMLPAGVACAALLVTGALCSGVLQARGAYLAPVLGRAAFNIGIVVMLFLKTEGGTAGAAARGLLVGGVLNVSVQLVALWRIGWRPAVPQLGHLHLGSAVAAGLPTVLGIFLVNFVSLAVQRAIGSNLDEGSLAAVNYAQRTLSIVSVLSLSIGTVSLTSLASAVARDPTGATARGAVGRHLLGIAWMIVPLSMWLAVVAAPLVSLLFQRGAYTSDSMVLTAECLRWFAVALVPGSFFMILQRASSAWDRNWLVALSSGGLTLTSALMTLLLLPLGPTALPIAVLGGNVVGLITQAWLLRRLVGLKGIVDAVRAAVAAGLRAAIAVTPLVIWSGWFLDAHGAFPELVLRLGTGLAIAAALYVFIGLATADRLTGELVRWGWALVRNYKQLLPSSRH